MLLLGSLWHSDLTYSHVQILGGIIPVSVTTQGWTELIPDIDAKEIAIDALRNTAAQIAEYTNSTMFSEAQGVYQIIPAEQIGQFISLAVQTYHEYMQHHQS